MQTTLKQIVHFRPCNEGVSKLMNGLDIECTENNWNEVYHQLSEEIKNQEIDFRFILKNNGIEDTFWVLRTQEEKTVMPILADVAESVLYIYEEKYPNDSRVRDCIQGIRDYCNDKITKEELFKLRNAAADAYSAAAADAYSVYSAAFSVYSAYSAYAAADAAYYASAREKQWEKNEEILLKYI